MAEVLIRVLNSSTGVPVTGLTGTEIKFRISPYGAGDLITGLTVTERGVQGNYEISGFTTYQDTKLYISTVEQTWWGIQKTGDVSDAMVTKTTTQTISGTKTFSGTFKATGNAFLDNPYIEATGAQYLSGVPTSDNSLVWKGYGTATYLNKLTGGYFPVNANTLIVDAGQATDNAQHVYNTIQEAIDYANGTTPSSSNRWTILIVPHKNTLSYQGYDEDLTLYHFIDLIGLGMVMIKGTLSYSGTWTGAIYARMANLVIKSGDDDGNIVRGLGCDNCHFYVTEDSLTPTLSLQNSQFNNCGFWKYGTVTNDIATTGNNTIMNCIGNSAITWDGTDTVFSYDYVADTSKYYQLT